MCPAVDNHLQEFGMGYTYYIYFLMQKYVYNVLIIDLCNYKIQNNECKDIRLKKFPLSDH